MLSGNECTDCGGFTIFQSISEGEVQTLECIQSFLLFVFCVTVCILCFMLNNDPLLID